MANITIKRANEELASSFGGKNAEAAVSTWYLCLSITPMDKNGVGMKEPIIQSNGYRRLAVQNTSGSGGSWEIPANGKVRNAIAFKFPMFEVAPTVPGMTGDLFATSWFLTKSPTDTSQASVCYMGTFTDKVWLAARTEISIGAGEIVIEYDLT